MNYLIEKGIEAARLTSKGLGETQLLLSEDAEESRKITSCPDHACRYSRAGRRCGTAPCRGRDGRAVLARL